MKLDEKFRTGVLWQDFQHSRLIGLLEKLKTSREEGNDSDVFGYAVAFLAMYVNDHFDLEKTYMAEYGYPEAENHLKKHGEFIRQVKELRNKYSGYSEEAMNSVIENIREWIKAHILNDDKELGEFILEKENGKTG